MHLPGIAYAHFGLGIKSVTPFMSLAKTPKEVKRVKAGLEAIPEKDRKGCILQELTMFECDRELAEKEGIIKCYPIPRIFRVYGYTGVLSHLLGLTHPKVSWTTRNRSYLSCQVRRKNWESLVTRKLPVRLQLSHYCP